jgi:amidase
MATATEHRLSRDQIIWGFGPDLDPVLEAFVFISIACDVNVCQACQPSPFSAIARVEVPKIAACPRPFSAR